MMRIGPGDIKYYDNRIEFSTRERIFGECMTSVRYSIGWKDNLWEKNTFIYSRADENACTRTLDEQYRNIIYREELSGYKLVQSVVNLSLPGSSNFMHRDQYGVQNNLITVLYNVNLEWDKRWGGGTHFWDPYSGELKWVSEYVPGRVVAFDGEIDHCAGTFSYQAPQYRFTIAMWYVPEE